MKIFHCDHCGQLLFFENTAVCQLRPPRRLPAGPAAGRLARCRWRRHRGARRCRAAEDAATGSAETTKSKRLQLGGAGRRSTNPLCVSCRLTRVIPDLAEPGHRAAWYRLEVAKRRLLFTLIELGLPLPNRDRRSGARARVRVPRRSAEPGAPPVLTGHADGVITINIAEADDAERERRRPAMHEPYRTLLGHMRHESGHYYWDRLIAGHDRDSTSSESLFGDERADYAAGAAARTTRTGRRADWQAAVRQRLRQRAPVGGLGRDLGALPAHGRHARNRGRVRPVAEAAARATSRRCRRCRASAGAAEPRSIG